jgi:uncharacterized damage-inducible protein DinB
VSVIHQLPWVQRTFSFDFPVEIWPDVVERFRGAPARVEDRVKGLSREALTRSDGGWSIQENVGHLMDLESLWDARLDDFLAGAAELRAADITNRATTEAGHNLREIGGLLRAFRSRRERAAGRLGTLNEADFSRTSIHPRLKVKMRLVDAVAFVCAHDDYHLARIGELVQKFGAT